MFRTIELAQIHRIIGHVSAGAIFNALKRACPIVTEASDLSKLQDITKSCKGCQLYVEQPNRYQVVLPNQCVFNFDVAIDVMYIDNHATLQIVCKQSHFSCAILLSKLDLITLWSAYMQTWVIPYLGVLYKYWVDQAKLFLSVRFTAISNALWYNFLLIAFESHWSLIAERYHAPLRRLTRKL